MPKVEVIKLKKGVLLMCSLVNDVSCLLTRSKSVASLTTFGIVRFDIDRM